MLRSFTRLRGILLALGLGAAQACSQRPADQPAPTGSPAGTALSVAEARAWYQATYAGSTAAATPGPQLPAPASAAGAAPGSAPAALVWERALTVGAGSQQLVLVPLAGDAALFARRPYAGTRYLIVTRTSTNALDGSLVEVLLRRTTAPLDTLALFTNLYHSYRSGRFAAPGTGEGYVFLYSADYRYQAGRPFRHGQFVRGSARLGFQPVPGTGTGTAPATGKGTGGVAKTDNVPPIDACIDWYDANTGDFIVRTGNCNDVGGGDGVPHVYTGGGGPGGSSPGPGGYGGHGPSGGGGHTSVPGMPTTMPKQTGAGTCVPASLAQVKLSLCGGSQTLGQIEGAMDLYGIQSFNDPNFINNGVPLSGMGGFVDHFFYTTILAPAGNIRGAINAGYPVMIDVFAYMDGPNTSVFHSVVITGYNPNNPSQVYYLDPGTGTTQTGDANSMYANSHYAIPITGCK